MFKVNDYVTYTYYKTGKIEKVHYDDPPDLYPNLIMSDFTFFISFFVSIKCKDTSVLFRIKVLLNYCTLG